MNAQQGKKNRNREKMYFLSPASTCHFFKKNGKKLICLYKFMGLLLDKFSYPKIREEGIL